MLTAAPKLSPTQVSATSGDQTRNEFQPVVVRAMAGTVMARNPPVRQIPRHSGLALNLIVVSFSERSSDATAKSPASIRKDPTHRGGTGLSRFLSLLVYRVVALT